MLNRFAKCGFIFLLTLTLLCSMGGTGFAAPYHGEIFQFKQPDNTYVDVKIFGDEYYQRAESLDGYALCYDENGWICYAELNEDGSDYVSTGIVYRGVVQGQKAIIRNRQGKALAKGLRLHKKHILDKANKTRRLLNPSAEPLEGSSAAPAPMAAAPAPITGQVRGLALLINFPDVTSSISRTEIDNMLNQAGYTGYNNNGSVRDYFYSVSNGLMTYTNYVTEFYTAKNPKSYYTDPNVQYAQRAMELVKEALQWLDSRGFDFSTLTTDSNRNILAINCFYAGQPDSQWGKGLWPHQGWINPKYSVDGVYCYKYQMSNIGTSLSIGTTVHENGHMVCSWPDLYDYDGDSAGAGRFCVMSYNDSKNPQVPNPYFRQTAGWLSYTSLNSYPSGSQITVNAGTLTTAYRWTGSDPSEFFLVENIRRTGRWAALPGEGLLIWHVDTDGNNNYNEMTPSRHFRVSVEQADGQFHLERNVNSGQANDFYYAGNKTLFDNTTTPNSNWWNGSASGLRISNVSAIGNTMTFILGTGTAATPTNTPTSSIIATPTVTPTASIVPTPTPTPTPTAQTNPIVWYRFDETSGTTAVDSSGNGKNATLNGGATWVAGRIANAVNLSGSSQYVSMPSGIVSALNDFTIATWVKLDTLSTWSRIFDFGTGTSVNMFLTPQSGSGMRFAITTGGSGAEQRITASSALPTGVWKHVAVTLSGNTGILYVDGAEVARNSNMTLRPSSLGTTGNNYIGRSQYSDPYLDGQVDDFRIYNRALSAAEIQGLFGGTPTQIPTATPTPTASIINTPTATPTASVLSTPTPTPSASPQGGYTVVYDISNDWNTGATINVTVKNNTSSPVNGWTLVWTFPGNQQISNMWGGTYTQNGASVSVKPVDYTTVIGANGGSIVFGFNINYSGTNQKPASFTLNGIPCEIQ